MCVGLFFLCQCVCMRLLVFVYVSSDVCLPEPDQGHRLDREAADLPEAPGTGTEEPRAGGSQLPGGSPETAEDHPPAGEGPRPLHQRDQRPQEQGRRALGCFDFDKLSVDLSDVIWSGVD